jgi:hypothetical protein
MLLEDNGKWEVLDNPEEDDRRRNRRRLADSSSSPKGRRGTIAQQERRRRRLADTAKMEFTIEVPFFCPYLYPTLGLINSPNTTLASLAEPTGHRRGRLAALRGRPRKNQDGAHLGAEFEVVRRPCGLWCLLRGLVH